MLARGPLEVEQAAAGVGVAVDERTGEQVGDEPDTVGGSQPDRLGREERQQAGAVEPAGDRVLRARAPVGVVEQPAGRGEPARERPAPSSAPDAAGRRAR